jgi:HAMP domain-containing protein
VLVAGLFVLIFSRTIIRDIRSLNRIATEISMGNKNVQMNVERTDEIGELAESFGRMVASLKIMMPDTDGAPGGEEPRP